MSEQVLYYDVCIECGSENLSVEISKIEQDMVSVACRTCGIDWKDYIEDIRNELR